LTYFPQPSIVNSERGLTYFPQPSIVNTDRGFQFYLFLRLLRLNLGTILALFYFFCFALHIVNNKTVNNKYFCKLINSYMNTTHSSRKPQTGKHRNNNNIS
jgi:hypothetical protein